MAQQHDLAIVLRQLHHSLHDEPALLLVRYDVVGSRHGTTGLLCLLACAPTLLAALGAGEQIARHGGQPATPVAQVGWPLGERSGVGLLSEVFGSMLIAAQLPREAADEVHIGQQVSRIFGDCGVHRCGDSAAMPA